MITISIDKSVFNKKIKSLENELLKPSFKDISNLARFSFAQNFYSQGRPTAWLTSKIAIKQKRLTLVDKGLLLRSVSNEFEKYNINNIVNNTELLLGTKVHYAKYHNHNESNMRFVARKFILLQEKDKTKIKSIIKSNILKAYL